MADLWTPPEEFASPEGLVWPEILWAALDCPGAFAVGSCDNPMVLGRITGQILERPTPGQSLIVAGKGRTERLSFFTAVPHSGLMTPLERSL